MCEAGVPCKIGTDRTKLTIASLLIILLVFLTEARAFKAFAHLYIYGKTPRPGLKQPNRALRSAGGTDQTTAQHLRVF